MDNKEYKVAPKDFLNLDIMESKDAEDPSRRDFLKLMGFSFAITALSACSAPPKKVIPYLVKPEEITPGVANWYASTCAGCSAGCGVLVKNRDGRPIKIEGNPEHPLSKGSVCAVGQATVLSLYDSARLKGPRNRTKDLTWDEVDQKMLAYLKDIQAQQGKIVILSSTILSPSTKAVIEDFSHVYKNTQHIVYDASSTFAIREAHGVTFGQPVLPTYHLDKADVIVNLGADFLSTWISPVEFTKQYVSRRNPNQGAMSRHIQFESRMTLTGANADVRYSVEPYEQKQILLGLLKYLNQWDQTHPISTPFTGQPISVSENKIEAIAKELWQNRGKALVLCGMNNIHMQVVVNLINQMLGAYTTIIDVDNISYQKQGNDRAVVEWVEEMNKGKVAALFVYGANPLYSYPDVDYFMRALKEVPLKVSFADRLDETTSEMDYICPDHHFLESWNDAEPISNLFSITQPVIAPFFNTRSMPESLLIWMNKKEDYYTYIQNYWKKNIFPKQNKFSNFQNFWDETVHDGVYKLSPKVRNTREKRFSNGTAAITMLVKANRSDLSLSLYEKTGMREGQHANNPWLQELPDPVTKITWDNYAMMSTKLAKEKEIKQGDIIQMVMDRQRVELPVVVLPGQAEKTVGVAMGYGRIAAGKAGNGVGKNIYRSVVYREGSFQYDIGGIQISKTDSCKKLASTQLHYEMEGRPIVRETVLSEFIKNPKSGNEDEYATHSLWKEHKKEGAFWGMVIDLNSCTGCSACVIACQAENNIPSVGAQEVSRNREMHWMRIDRYYKESETMTEVVHQPMLCQHCEHAPCETVCPTLATTHSTDGLNMQTYNRCVGTRYCANNCPYKVRRFNWLNYSHDDLLANMVLNPDVVVRSRGIMEKCTMCVQRIQEKEMKARGENRLLQDGEILTACQQTCPADAIVFGNMNDPNSRVSKLKQNPRNYTVLAELKTLPTVSYLTKVKNKKVSES